MKSLHTWNWFWLNTDALFCFLLSFRANIDEVETEVVEIEAKLDKVTHRTLGTI